MAVTRQLARIAKLLVDSEGIEFPDAEARLRALTLEIVVGADATSAAAHAAVLTAVSVGHRSFVGGVRVSGAIKQRLNSALPLMGRTLGDAAYEIGASAFDGVPAWRIVVGDLGDGEEADIAAWCD